MSDPIVHLISSAELQRLSLAVKAGNDTPTARFTCGVFNLNGTCTKDINKVTCEVCIQEQSNE